MTPPPLLRQFTPALYLLLLAGMGGYALAAQSAGVWVIGFGGVLLNAWLVSSGRFVPLPRVAANVLTVGALVFTVRQLFGAGTSAVLVLGQFLVALQLVKLWETRANRDHAQLIVLSLLLMVAASINTVSLLFGALLVGYMFLSLYCCLLFHLKVDMETARSTLGPPADEPPPSAADGPGRLALTRSMRRLTGVISAAAVAAAVVVFVAFPRGTGQNVFANLQFNPAQTLTGFSEEVNLTDVTRITQNEAVVAHVEVFKDDERVEGTEPLLLRGLTLDTYSTDGKGGQWTRRQRTLPPKSAPKDQPVQLRDGGPAGRWRQRVLLQPTGTRTIFAIPAPTAVTFRRNVSYTFDADGVLQTETPIGVPVEYEVSSSGVVDTRDAAATYPARGNRGFVPAEIEPAIREYALRAGVGGSDADGPLAARRLAAETARRLTGDSRKPHPLDAPIAAALERHLRGPEFAYTLDTTDAKNRSGKDPYVWFLSPDGHRGHCEYFAGAMALMCQSLGMNARVVVGFKCDEYNATPGADYYIVRQSHAHAWVEVLTERGWMTFDPTNGREDNRAVRTADAWTKFKHFVDFLEYTYATNVIAYDNRNQENLLQAVESRMTAPIYRTINSGYFDKRWPRASELLDRLTASVTGMAGTLVGVGAVMLAAGLVWRHVQLRRRARRIGLDALPPEERLRLARQLGFYDDLVRLLARYKITRPPHQTPMEFARSLLSVPADVADAARRLTGVFYRVRFGRADLTPGQRRHLANTVARLEAALAAAPPGRILPTN